MAKTKTIGFGVTRSQPGFNNVRVYQEVELEEGDDVSFCWHALQLNVHNVANSTGEVDQLRNDEAELRSSVRDLERRKIKLRDDIEILRGILEQCNALSPDPDLPF